MLELALITRLVVRISAVVLAMDCSPPVVDSDTAFAVKPEMVSARLIVIIIRIF